MMPAFYPWQLAVRTRWMAPDRQRHHALLLHGKPGIAKLAFARAMAAGLLCRAPVDGAACGQCESCHWFDEQTHPDFREITPEDDMPADPKKKARKREHILIEQIRALHEYLSLSNHQVDGMRVVLIHPLEAMHAAAANALLKLLEEPPARTQFLLVSHQRQNLLATILSRCMQVEMPVPSMAQGVDWLRQQSVAQPEWAWYYSGGAPLLVPQLGFDLHAWYRLWLPQLARGAALDIAVTVPLLLQQGMTQAIDVLQKWSMDLNLYAAGLPCRYHVSDEATFHTLTQKMQRAGLLAFQRQLNRFKMTAQHPLNQELQLEQLLLQYKKMFTELSGR